MGTGLRRSDGIGRREEGLAEKPRGKLDGSEELKGAVSDSQLEARAVRTTGIGPPDIVDGNVTLVLGLVYSIIAWSTTRARVGWIWEHGQR